MNISFTLVAAVGVIAIFMLLMVLFFVPASRKSKKRKRRPPEQLSKEKDWKGTALKLERYIYSLREDISRLEKGTGRLERDLEKEKKKATTLADKLKREQGWHAKEQSSIDRSDEEIDKLKEGLRKAEQVQGEAHSVRLRLERECKEIKRECEDANEERRSIEKEYLKAKAALEGYKGELVELRRENRELQKKSDDTDWIAKNEYIKLERLLKEKEKEFEREHRQWEKQFEQIKKEIR